VTHNHGMRVLRHLAMLIVVAPIVVVAAPQQSITVRPLTISPKPGDVFLLEAIASAPIDRMHARIFDRAIAMWPDAKRPRVWQALIGVDVETKPGEYPLIIEGEGGSGSGGASSTKTMIAVAPKVFGVRRLRVEPRYAEPPASERARIEREAKRLHEIYATLTPAFHWTSPVARPVTDRSSSPFGLKSVFNGEERGRHNGVDFASPAGTPVHAPAAGRVALAEDLYYTGNTVIIDHG
jgi:Peptidase family M23